MKFVVQDISDKLLKESFPMVWDIPISVVNDQESPDTSAVKELLEPYCDEVDNGQIMITVDSREINFAVQYITVCDWNNNLIVKFRRDE